jgi:hypothetical protein
MLIHTLLSSIFSGLLGFAKETNISTITSISNDYLKPPGITALEETLKVPENVPYTNVYFCSILQVSYYLEIDAEKSKSEMPIVITGVPLRFENQHESDFLITL